MPQQMGGMGVPMQGGMGGGMGGAAIAPLNMPLCAVRPSGTVGGSVGRAIPPPNTGAVAESWGAAACAPPLADAASLPAARGAELTGSAGCSKAGMSWPAPTWRTVAPRSRRRAESTTKMRPASSANAVSNTASHIAPVAGHPPSSSRRDCVGTYFLLLLGGVENDFP